ncbi:putative sugar nucleotidyl transferase [Sphingobacterium zeae]|uniref:UDP-N-acetylglucosamine diphosphorylase/glucosamine-1-phosphate N-acetyltransferase n=1 Tax=Sphingobacterium zeae TaxID=1776859 RepID=A0ABU0U4Z1_9SPHI|nr:putative sugar nucleotidyl transferase [Sphingobacterium zeae]MDQ1149321.1 UDP-N-acetylglucosamine diphosphorylase/glucosamine-1-phosphate N-acetyltransferase [Sphingobacterium zeae]
MKISFTDCFDAIHMLDRHISNLTTFNKKALYPLTFIKSCLDLRVGVLTLREKWKKIGSTYSVQFVGNWDHEEGLIFVSENLVPSTALMEALKKIDIGEVLVQDGYVLCCRYTCTGFYRVTEIGCDVSILKGVEDLFLLNGPEITRDFDLLIEDVKLPCISETNQVLGNHIFIAHNVSMECATLNSLHGPIYIDEGVTIMEGAHLRGPLYLGRGSVVKMGTTIYGNVSVGEQAVVGGEIGNSVIGDFSAKGHHGYLGCSVIGDWCNLGAGTSNSNLKNNLKTVAIYDYALNRDRDTGLLKCGSFIGDYTRIGINSALNTGTVIGLASMLADTSFYAKFVPSFAWVFGGRTETYEFDKFIAYLEALYASKGKVLTEQIKDKLIQLNKKYN